MMDFAKVMLSVSFFLTSNTASNVMGVSFTRSKYALENAPLAWKVAIFASVAFFSVFIICTVIVVVDEPVVISLAVTFSNLSCMVLLTPTRIA